jgi:PAS domain-containing protein
VLTPDLRIKSANSAFYTLFGLGEGEVEGCLIYDLSNRQWDIPQLRSLLTDVTTRHVQVHGFELTYQFAGLGEKVLSLNASRVVRQHEAILLTIDDITEQRRSQRFLEEREAWFHQIADNAPTLIWVVGPDGQYTFLNNVWLNYTGASLAYVVVNGWGKTMHPDDRNDTKKRIRAISESGSLFRPSIACANTMVITTGCSKTPSRFLRPKKSLPVSLARPPTCRPIKN